VCLAASQPQQLQSFAAVQQQLVLHLQPCLIGLEVLHLQELGGKLQEDSGWW
jgi:hypothetical protein